MNEQTDMWFMYGKRLDRDKVMKYDYLEDDGGMIMATDTIAHSTEERNDITKRWQRKGLTVYVCPVTLIDAIKDKDDE